MSDQTDLVAMASAAAAALVAEMTKDAWATMRAAAARLFGHGGKDEQERHVRRMDADHAQVAELSESDLVDRWKRRFLTLVEDYPDAIPELAALAASNSKEPFSLNQNAVGNQGPVIQIGRDNSGGIKIGEN
ncbi:hypothetical protein [Actinomadura harenae]|uniref:hypothetical protein n=1 Tax=Actinomadura harenae TaxID=2483351 RepID=UPI0011C3759E|nr:hypothetical protein [Actinomadura harenae]